MAELSAEQAIVEQGGTATVQPQQQQDQGEGGSSSSSDPQSSPPQNNNDEPSSSYGPQAAADTGCTSNSDCCDTCVCIVKKKTVWNSIKENAGKFILGCIAQSMINPKRRDPGELRKRDEQYAYEAIDMFDEW